MNVSMVLVQADGTQREIPLKKAVQVIGRQTDCQLRIPSANVSRHHCEVIVSDSGVSLRDLGSSNGTFVNKQRIQQAQVAPGDLVSLGGLVFVLRVDGKPEFIDSDDVLEDGLVGPEEPMESSRPSSVTVSTGQPARPAAKAATPNKPSLVDSSEDSSVADFDFLDDDDDKSQPKL
ncbi:MAG: FHA domain-containing protein [Planctomycetes bacterium]|nr:FHA domain-containing protein [Planctomycetota bacterium]